jgi:hypothetical protein
VAVMPPDPRHAHLHRMPVPVQYAVHIVVDDIFIANWLDHDGA